jgi:hypothetical protein
VREIRTLRSTWRGLETWHGRNSVTLANERASNREYKLRPKPARQSSTLPVRGSGCNSPGLLGACDETCVPTATHPLPRPHYPSRRRGGGMADCGASAKCRRSASGRGSVA